MNWLMGVATETSRPRRTTAPVCASSSEGSPLTISRYIEVVASCGKVSANSTQRSITSSASSLTPRALPDRDDLAHDILKHLAGRLVVANFADRRAGDGADAAERGDEDELLPQRRFDVAGDFGAERRRRSGFRSRCFGLWRGAVRRSARR